MFFKKLKKVAAKDKPKSAKFIAPLEMPHRRAHQRGISETSLQASKKGDEVTKEISSIKKKDAVTTKSDAATSSSIGNKERHAAERRQKLKELAIKKNENKATSTLKTAAPSAGVMKSSVPKNQKLLFALQEDSGPSTSKKKSSVKEKDFVKPQRKKTF